jgi:serine/threonine protein kinase
MSDDLENKVIFNKYKIEKKIGEGSFGKIYSASSILTGEKCALKFENRTHTHNLLEAESCVIAYLHGSKLK